METFSSLLALCAGNSPVTGEFPWQRSVMRSLDVSLICAWVNGWVNNCDAGDLRRHRAHDDVNVMITSKTKESLNLLHFIHRGSQCSANQKLSDTILNTKLCNSAYHYHMQHTLCISDMLIPWGSPLILSFCIYHLSCQPQDTNLPSALSDKITSITQLSIFGIDSFAPGRFEWNFK